MLFQSLHFFCRHALAACATVSVEWGPYVHLVYFQESMFKVYEVEFHPIPDEKLWPEWHGTRLYPNPAMHRKVTSRPISTRFYSNMDEVEHKEKRCGLFQQTSILYLLFRHNVQPLHAESDVLWSRHCSSSGVPPTPLPLGRSPSVWLHLPGMPTVIRDIS
ncbi:hypothetical protein Ahy_B09g098733 [Arachis hypogaea]|uniref:Aminotransferase-like plant mobile domain-containing protein n=1 Tax=Arachis hypogaea TaxID=3818 RepID=A0A444XRY0_ARAHY|nr:hypothetical protein Ahy_B09g098733 [Arachis hypogaea]